MTMINKNTNASYNSKAPSIEKDADKVIEVVFPTQEKVTVDGSDDASVTVERAFTVVEIEVSDDITLDAELSTNLKHGDMILVKATAVDDDRVLTLGANLGGATIDLTEDAEEDLLLVYDGTKFVAVSKGDGADGATGPAGPTGPAYVPADNSIVPAKLQKGVNDAKTYTLKSTAGVVAWVEDV